MSTTHMTLVDFYNTHQKLAADEVILDVRNRDEYASGHIANALNIPLPEISSHVEELKKYQTVYIHCKRGGRAKTAFEALAHAGLKNLVCVHDAGMDSWIESGYPVAK